MKRDFGVAIVGCGKWGINHVRTASQLFGDKLKLVCDLSEKSLVQARAVAPSVSTTDSLEEVLDRHDIDAVIVASGAETHYEIGKRCLQSGKHCLLEKPLTLDSENARELIALSEDRKLTLMVGHLMLYHPAVVHIRREILSGNIGQMLYMYSQRVNLGTIRRQENAFWSLCDPHL